MQTFHGRLREDHLTERERDVDLVHGLIFVEKNLIGWCRFLPGLLRVLKEK
jgi:hypothetical protein